MTFEFCFSEKFKKEFRVACKLCGLAPTHGRHGTLTGRF